MGVAEIDLVLARTLLMVGAFRVDAHLLKGKADLPADIFPLVVRGDVHVAGPVIGELCRLAFFVQAEEVKFLLSAEEELESGFPGRIRRFL